MNKPAKAIDLLENDRRVLQSWVRAHNTPQQIARRGMIILRASEGMANSRSMAKAQGVSHAMVQRIWDAHGLQPNRVKTFKPSRDKRIEEKLTDVVGPYMNPSDKVIVLCVDVIIQIQALDRTQPGLPLKRESGGTMTHDYKRDGAAALNIVNNGVPAKTTFQQIASWAIV